MDALGVSSLPISFDFRKETWLHTLILSFQSIGVIFGRLSTAPMYVLESIQQEEITSADEMNELFSFVFWTLTVFPLLKYSFIVLRADNNGEGGPFSLYSLFCRHASVGVIPSNGKSDMAFHHVEKSPSKNKLESKARRTLEKHKSCHYLLFFLALLGACMILSDAVLTPAISVLSATSGLGRSLAEISVKFSSSEAAKHSLEKALKKYVPTPAACAILVCLFMLQQHGTKRIGIIFAPIVITWLFFISGFGLYNIIHYKMHIFHALSPVYMLRFMKKISLRRWKLLSSMVLCIAGTESMFADLGHFSRKSIKMTFIIFIYPALLITYAGQASFIANNINFEDAFHLRESIPNKNLQHVFAVLSLFATAVGSQGPITAGFSIISQCQALGCFPRVKVVHTSEQVRGQVYVPDVNWLFMVLSLTFTIGLHDVSQLGKAIGLAVTCGMLVTTFLMSLVISLYWGKSLFVSALFFLFFGSIESMYLSASLVNFIGGTWCLVILLFLFLTIMATWYYGTLKKYEFDVENKVSIDWLTDYSPGLGVSRVPGIGFIYSDIENGIPAFFSRFITNLPAYHQVLIFVSFKSFAEPYVPDSRRYLVGRVGPREYRIYRCIVQYGYRDSVRDTDDFEDKIISSIGDYITREEYDCEAMDSPEGKMMALGGPVGDGSVFIPVDDIIDPSSCSPSHNPTESKRHLLDSPLGSTSSSDPNPSRKKVRFVLPPKTRSSGMPPAVRQELQEIIDARESGTAYFLGQSHLLARKGSNIFKKLVIMLYVFLERNSREPPVALDIPNAALLEVGTVYTI